MIMLVEKGDDTQGEANVVVINDESETEMEEEECIMLFLRTAMGYPGQKLQTMKVLAWLNGVLILFMMDNSATHNFISCWLEHKMGWSVKATKPM